MRELTLQDVSKLCTNMHYSQGFQHVNAAHVMIRWHQAHAVGGQVRDHRRTHDVRVNEESDGSLVPSCTCTLHRQQPFCQHVAAILITWANEPESFTLYQGEPERKEANAPSRRAPEDRLAALRTTLRRIETMLFNLLSHGLLTFSSSDLKMVREIGTAARQHNLGRITAAVEVIVGELATLNRAAPSSLPLPAPHRQPDEARYTEALITAWHLTQAAIQAVEVPDIAWLHEVVGLPIEETSAQEPCDVKLVELAYCTDILPYHDQAIENSYLLDLLSGRLMAERYQLLRKHRTHSSKKSYSGVLQANAVVAPGYDVDEIVCGLDEPLSLEVADSHTWQQACEWAVRNWDEPRQHLLRTSAALPGVRAVHAWFAPSGVVIDDGTLYLLDQNRKGIRAQSAQAIEWKLQHAPLAAVFGRLEAEPESLTYHALSLLCGDEELELVRLSN